MASKRPREEERPQEPSTPPWKPVSAHIASPGMRLTSSEVCLRELEAAEQADWHVREQVTLEPPSPSPALILPPPFRPKASNYCPLPLENSLWQTYKRIRGLESLYPWQKKCFEETMVLHGENVVLSAPTAAGKTVVAETTALSIMFNQNTTRKGLIVLVVVPYVSLVVEMLENFQNIGMVCGFHAEGFHGANGNLPFPKNKPMVAICTIERAMMVFNDMIRQQRLKEIGGVIVDEIQFLGKGHRGATLELLLVKILRLAPFAQLVGMSATFSNMEKDLAAWLNAKAFRSDHRPVPLEEHILSVEEEQVVDVNGKVVEGLQLEQWCGKWGWVLNCVLPDQSIIVFVNSRQGTQNMAAMLSGIKHGTTNARARIAVKRRKEEMPNFYGEMIELLDREEPQLKKEIVGCVGRGVAFHHAGLSVKVRSFLEHAFRNRCINTLCCTSTMAAGVNLPASMVVLSNMKMGIDFISNGEYVQMAGRAGRGLKSSGKLGKVLVVLEDKKEKEMYLEIMRSGPAPVQSSLMDFEEMGMEEMKRLALDACCVGENPREFINATFLSVTKKHCRDQWIRMMEVAISSLLRDKLITGALEPTAIGCAVFSSSMTPTEGIELQKELEYHANMGIVLQRPLHLLLLACPSNLIRLDMRKHVPILIRFVENSAMDDKGVYRVACCVELTLKTLQNAKAGDASLAAKASMERFLCAFALQAIVEEESVSEVAEKFCLSNGDVQRLKDKAASRCYSFARFCSNVPSLWYFASLFKGFIPQLNFGIGYEITESGLMEVEKMTPLRARALWNCSIRSIEELARMSASSLAMRVPNLGSQHVNAVRVAEMLIRNARKLFVEESKQLMEDARERERIATMVEEIGTQESVAIDLE